MLAVFDLFILRRMYPPDLKLGSSVAEFWAVLDAKELPVIREAVRAGDRRTALSLICERSAFIGSILPDS